MKFAFAVLVAALSVTAIAEEAAAPAHVKNLSGCFKVSYRFVEDGKHDYEIPQAFEWIQLREEKGVFRAQHYGVGEEFGGQIMKHFYENWTALPNGTWRQDVHGPSGAHRYTCESAVRFGQLRCESKGAPRPLRDSKRTDYDKLNRGTTIQVTPRGWVQNEINDKVDKAGKVVATEVGWVEYRRLADEKPCEQAKKEFPNE